MDAENCLSGTGKEGLNRMQRVRRVLKNTVRGYITKDVGKRATAKWTFMSFIFVPFFANMGISPDMVQCAFRIGDSATNAITPFMFYMPLILTYMQQYDKQATYGSLLKYTWRYSLYILLAWTLLFILWYVTGLPLGL